MKRISVAAAGLIISLGVALGVAGVTHAQWSDNFKTSDETVTVAAKQTKPDEPVTTAPEKPASINVMCMLKV